MSQIDTIFIVAIVLFLLILLAGKGKKKTSDYSTGGRKHINKFGQSDHSRKWDEEDQHD